MSILSDMKMMKSWKATNGFLQKAKSLVPSDKLNEHQTQINKEFDEYLSHNELGLAFEQLEFLAETIELSRKFWNEMLSAAKQMKLEESAERCEENLN